MGDITFLKYSAAPGNMSTIWWPSAGGGGFGGIHEEAVIAMVRLRTKYNQRQT